MNKKNLTLAIILIVLVALAYVYKGPLKEWRENKVKPSNFLSLVNIDEVNKIKISQGDIVTLLEKQDDRWKISETKNFFVREDLALDMMEKLKSLVLADLELAGKNEEKKFEFLTNEISGTLVALMKNENQVAEFIVGKLARNFNSTYISENNSPNTYLADINLNFFTLNNWYDMTIFSAEKEKITNLRFQYPDHQFIIEKESKETEDEVATDEIWTGTSPYSFEVNKEKIEDILNIMSNLRATEIPEQNFEGTGLEKNLIIVQATGENIDNTIALS